MPEETDSSMATRPGLLARLKDWSQQTAWREFDRDYGPLLRNVARKAGLTEAEVDEVAQDTLIAVAKKIPEFHHAGRRGSFRAWLYQQARWRIADQFRARKRSSQYIPGSLVVPGQPPDHDSSGNGTAYPSEHITADSQTDPVFQRIWDSEWDDYIRLSALNRLKQQVSASQYQLFDLHVLQGLSVHEAAKAAGTTKAAVYMAKSRIGRLLKREVKKLTK